MESGTGVGTQQSLGGSVGDAEGEPESGRHWYSDLTPEQVGWYVWYIGQSFRMFTCKPIMTPGVTGFVYTWADDGQAVSEVGENAEHCAEGGEAVSSCE